MSGIESRSVAPLAPLVRRVAVVAMSLTGLGSLLLTQVSIDGSYFGDLFFALVILGPGFQIGGAVGVAILSSVAVSAAHGSEPLAALTDGYQSASPWRSPSRRSGGGGRPAARRAPRPHARRRGRAGRRLTNTYRQQETSHAST